MERSRCVSEHTYITGVTSCRAPGVKRPNGLHQAPALGVIVAQVLVPPKRRACVAIVRQRLADLLKTILPGDTGQQLRHVAFFAFALSKISLVNAVGGGLQPFTFGHLKPNIAQTG